MHGLQDEEFRSLLEERRKTARKSVAAAFTTTLHRREVVPSVLSVYAVLLRSGVADHHRAGQFRAGESPSPSGRTVRARPARQRRPCHNFVIGASSSFFFFFSLNCFCILIVVKCIYWLTMQGTATQPTSSIYIIIRHCRGLHTEPPGHIERTRDSLEAMDFDATLVCDSLSREEGRDVLALITRELYDFGIVFVFNNCSIATKLVLKSFQQTVLVEFGGNALQSLTISKIYCTRKTSRMESVPEPS